jgi:hypothetical protein
MYRKTRKDFMEIKLMSEQELRIAVQKAVNEYIEVQQYIKEVEDTLEERYNNKEITYFEYKAMLPKVDFIVSNLQNIEGYIRQACKRLDIPAEEVRNVKVEEEREVVRPVTFKRKKKVKTLLQFK